MSDTLLDVYGLCSGYGASQVLENVSFSMGVESVAIIGRNGMGKSTLCDTLIGLLPTTSGTFSLGGSLGQDMFKGLGLVGQFRPR